MSTSAELKQVIEQVIAERDALVEQRNAIIRALELGSTANGDKAAALAVGVEVDILNARVQRLQAEHFRALCDEAVAAYRAARVRVRDSAEQYRRARETSLAMMERHDKERRENQNAVTRIESERGAAREGLHAFTAKLEQGGDPVLEAVQEKLKAIDAEFN